MEKTINKMKDPSFMSSTETQLQSKFYVISLVAPTNNNNPQSF